MRCVIQTEPPAPPSSFALHSRRRPPGSRRRSAPGPRRSAPRRHRSPDRAAAAGLLRTVDAAERLGDRVVAVLTALRRCGCRRSRSRQDRGPDTTCSADTPGPETSIAPPASTISSPTSSVRDSGRRPDRPSDGGSASPRRRFAGLPASIRSVAHHAARDHLLASDPNRIVALQGHPARLRHVVEPVDPLPQVTLGDPRDRHSSVTVSPSAAIDAMRAAPFKSAGRPVVDLHPVTDEVRRDRRPRGRSPGSPPPLPAWADARPQGRQHASRRSAPPLSTTRSP